MPYMLRGLPRMSLALYPGYSDIRPARRRCSSPFSIKLKSAGVPVTLREYLVLMEAMEKDLASRRVEEFYYLSRAALVKDEPTSTSSTACSVTCSRD